MDLTVVLKRCNLKKLGNYFLVVQLDEQEFPSKLIKSSKMRTEILTKTSNPNFLKNIFSFPNLSLGSRITLKLGCFSTTYYEEGSNHKQLFQNSQRISFTTLTFTQRIITILREQTKYEEELVLYDDLTQQIEQGKILIQLRFKPATFDQMLEEDITKIQKIYYDPFEYDDEIIRNKIENVKEQLKLKQAHYQETIKKQDFMRTASKSILFTQGRLVQTKKQLEEENKMLKQKLDRFQNLDELHIHIDLVQNTEQGQDILRQKLAKLENKMNFEKVINNKLRDQYYQIEQFIVQKKRIDEQKKKVESASQEQDFHIKRCKDLYPQLERYKQTIQNQEALIQNLQKSFQQNLKKLDNFNCKEIDYELKSLAHEREILRHKHNQVAGLLELHDGQLPNKERDIILNETPFLKEDQEELKIYKERADQFLHEIEQLSRDLDNIKINRDIIEMNFENNRSDSQRQLEIQEKKFQINLYENKADELEQQIIRTSKESARQIADYKYQLAELEALIKAHTNVNYY